MDMVIIILSLRLLYLLAFDVDMGQRYAFLCLFWFVGANVVLG
jgi:hypothetical protein